LEFNQPIENDLLWEYREECEDRYLTEGNEQSVLKKTHAGDVQAEI
jgi:hypothetical protein